MLGTTWKVIFNWDHLNGVASKVRVFGESVENYFVILPCQNIQKYLGFKWTVKHRIP